MAYSWERWYDGACVHNTMKGQGAGKICSLYDPISRFHYIGFFFTYFFSTGAKVAFFIRSTLWNRRPLTVKFHYTTFGFSSSISMSNQMVTSEIRKWFHAHFVKFLMIAWAFRQDKLWILPKRKHILLKSWVYYLITFLYHRWQITLAYGCVYL